MMFSQEAIRATRVIQEVKKSFAKHTATNFPISSLWPLVKYFREGCHVDPERDFVVNLALARIPKEEQDHLRQLIKDLSRTEYVLVETALLSLGGGVREKPYVAVRTFYPLDNGKVSEIFYLLQSSPTSQSRHDTL